MDLTISDVLQSAPPLEADKEPTLSLADALRAGAGNEAGAWAQNEARRIGLESAQRYLDNPETGAYSQSWEQTRGALAQHFPGADLTGLQGDFNAARDETFRNAVLGGYIRRYREEGVPADAWASWGLQHIPFAGSMASVLSESNLQDSLRRFQQGNPTEADFHRIASAEAISRQHADEDWAQRTGRLLADAVPFAIEFGATGGAFGATRTAAAAGLARLAPRLAATTAGRIGIQTAAGTAGLAALVGANPHQVVGRALEQSFQNDSSFLGELPAGGAHAGIELGTELLGGPAMRLLGAAPGAGALRAGMGALTERVGLARVSSALQNALARHLVRRGVASTEEAALRAVPNMLEHFGYHGVLGEMLEERMAEVGHGILGLEDGGVMGMIYDQAHRALTGQFPEGRRQREASAFLQDLAGQLSSEGAAFYLMGGAGSLAQIMNRGNYPRQGTPEYQSVRQMVLLELASLQNEQQVRAFLAKNGTHLDRLDINPESIRRDIDGQVFEAGYAQTETPPAAPPSGAIADQSAEQTTPPPAEAAPEVPPPAEQPPIPVDEQKNALSVISTGALPEEQRATPLGRFYEQAVERGYERGYATLSKAHFVAAAETHGGAEAAQAEFDRQFPEIARPLPREQSSTERPRGSWNHTGTQFFQTTAGLQFKDRTGQAHFVTGEYQEPTADPELSYREHGAFQIKILDAEGNEIGHVGFYRDAPDGPWRGEGLWVDPAHRGQGVSEAMYDYVTHMGEHVVPSTGRTAEGRRFWNRNQQQSNRQRLLERLKRGSKDVETPQQPAQTPRREVQFQEPGAPAQPEGWEKLTEYERQVVDAIQLEGGKLEDFARRRGVTRQAVHAAYERARKKVPSLPSISERQAAEQERRAGAAAERGATTPEDLHALNAEGQARQAVHDELRQIEQAIEVLNDAYVAEAEKEEPDERKLTELTDQAEALHRRLADAGRAAETAQPVAPAPSPPAAGRAEPAQPAPGPSAETSPNVATGQGPPAPGTVRPATTGDATTVRLATLGSLPARYAVLDLGQVQASHTVAEGHAKPNPAYPAGLQPRQYSPGSEEVEKVRRFSHEKEAGYFLSDTPSAADGPPMVTVQGAVVLNGNGRVMTLQNTQGDYGWYKDVLAKKAQQFGVSADVVRQMDLPILVRLVEVDPNSPQAKEIARAGNVSTTQAQSPLQTAASLGGLITEELIDSLHLDEDTTFSEAVVQDRGKQFRSLLRQQLPPSVAAQYLNKDNQLTEAGKEFVQGMLLTRLFPAELIERLGEGKKQLKRTLEAAIPQLLQMRREFPDISLVPQLAEALDFLASYPGVNTLQKAAAELDEGTLLGESLHNISAGGRMMVDFLINDGGKMKVFRHKIGSLNRDLALGTGLFSAETPDPAQLAADSLGVDVRQGAAFGEAGTVANGAVRYAGFPLRLDFLDRLLGRGVGLGGILRKWFFGSLPRAFFEEKIKRDGRLAGYLHQISVADYNLRRAVKQATGASYAQLSEQELRVMDNALRGDPTAQARLPKGIADSIQTMREQVDSLSRLLIDTGAISDDLVATVEGNIGVYLTRQYRVFQDPGWFDEVKEKHPGVVNRFKSWMHAEALSQGRLLSPEELDGITNSLLYNGTAAENPIAFLKSAKLGSKDLSILTRRKDVPAELRALWGEYREPLVNYTQSVGRMAGLLTNHLFLTRVRGAGLGVHFFAEPTPTHFAQIATEGSRVMEPLNGLYTTPDIKKAFEQIYAPRNESGWVRGYMMAVGLAKYAKAVFSHVAIIRNFLGNIGFGVANGHFMVQHWPTAIHTLAARSDEARQLHRRLLDLNVIGQDVHAGELRQVVSDILGEKQDAAGLSIGVITEKWIARSVRQGVGAVSHVYQTMDAFWKVFAFLNEQQRYRAAHPGWTQDQVDERAAWIVRNTYPTYSHIPQAVQGLRRFPFVGPFLSFPAEVIRNTFNTVRIGWQEIHDPATRAIGWTRLAGVTAATTGMTILAIGVRALMGISKDDEDDMRRFMPEWSRNSPILHLGGADGQYSYFDLGYSDPYSVLRAPIIALFQGHTPEESLTNAAWEAGRPFIFDEDLFTGRVLDVARNRQRSGREVVNPQAGAMERAQGYAAHIGGIFVPGAIEHGRRLALAATGTPEQRTGREHNLTTEAVAQGLGQRRSDLDVATSLYFNARRFSEARRDTQRLMTGVARQRGLVSDEELVAAHQAMELQRRHLYDEMRQDVLAAGHLGVPEAEIRSALDRAGLSRADVQDLLNGTYRRHFPASGFLGASAGDPQQVIEMRRREILLQRTALEAMDEQTRNRYLGEQLWRAAEPLPRRQLRESWDHFQQRLSQRNERAQRAGALLSEFRLSGDQLDELFRSEVQRRGLSWRNPSVRGRFRGLQSLGE